MLALVRLAGRAAEWRGGGVERASVPNTWCAVPPTHDSCPAPISPILLFSPEGCGTCDTSLTACDQDSSCLDGYGPGDKPNTCVACSINNCTSCDASYKICTMCSDGFRFNAPAEKCEGRPARRGPE